MISTERKEPDLHSIARIVCDKFRMIPREVFKTTRQRHIIIVRQIFCYVSRRSTSKSLSAIGDFMGKFRGEPYNHATVVHAIKQTEAHLCYDKDYQRIIPDLLLEVDWKQSYQGVVVTNVNLIDSCRYEKR